MSTLAWIKGLIARARSNPPAPQSAYSVTVSAASIVCRGRDGIEQAVAWEDLETVAIETNDSGPWGIDSWWKLLRRDGTGCAVPLGAAGEDGLLPALQERLPGFDNEAVILAMGSTEIARFPCWAKDVARRGDSPS